MTTKTDALSSAEIALLRARRSYLLAEIVVINEKLAKVHAKSDGQVLDLSVYDPAWKAGNHLTPQGKFAILSAFDQLITQADVAKIFNISLTAANNWHRRWKLQRLGDIL